MEKPILAVMLSLSGTTLSDEEKFLLQKSNPLGISLFARNISDKKQLQKLTAQIRSCIGRNNILIAVDQEGGRVRRLREPDYIPFASQSALGALAAGNNPSEAIRTVIKHSFLTAQDLLENGINLNYAPVLDIAYPQTNAVLKSRCFGSDEKLVALLGEIMVEEYIINHICPCIKHLPGHGRAETDPHLSLPVIHDSLSELERDFYPFRILNDAPAGMSAHILIPEIDSQYPVTMSKTAIDKLIRGSIGFNGFLFSDAIDMNALPGNLSERTLASLSAGCDAVCYCMGQLDGLQQVVAAARPLTDHALNRLQAVFQIIKPLPNSKIVEDYQKTVGKIEQYDNNYDATEVLHRMIKQ